MLKISVTSDLGGLGTMLEKRASDAVRAVESAVLASCEPYVPYHTGELCRSGTASGSGEVRWTASHAHECYYADREFNKKIHPQACARWFEAAKAVDGGAWVQTAARALGI